MNNPLIVSIIYTLTLVATCKVASAQSDADSAIYQQASGNLVNYFYSGIGLESRLNNGFVYEGYNTSITGNPYLDDVENWTTATVDYDGVTFEGVQMLYDLYADKLIILQYKNGSPSACRLVSDKVTGFDLRRRHFVRIDGEDNGLKSGFYEQLYGGRSQVVNKLEKIIKTTSASSGASRYFAPAYNYQEYYVRKGQKYYPVSSLRSMLDVFRDKKKALRRYIRDNDIQFNGLHELAMVEIARYYDHLTD